MQFLKAWLKNWKTSSAAMPALGVVIVEIGKLLQGETPNWEVLIAAASAAIGFLLAKDGDQTGLAK